MCFLCLLNCNSNGVDSSYKLEIHAVGYPSGRTITYVVNNDSLFILNSNTRTGLDSLLLMNSEIDFIRMAIFGTNLDTMASEYINPYVKDGNALYITIESQHIKKMVYVSNVYLAELDKIISEVNKVLSNRGLSKYYINYKGEKTKRSEDY